jgi:hypothetical protein
LSLLDTYKKNVQRKNEEISRIQKEKAKEQQKLADLLGKIQKASEAIKRTSNSSIIKSKLREIDRHQKEEARFDKKVADFEAKIARKQKEMLSEEKKATREEEKENKKRRQIAEKQTRENKRYITNINNTLATHDRLHQETRSVLERLQHLPEKIIVLFFAANPLNKQQLRLDEEARAISEMIRKARLRESVKFESCWAVRPLDVLQAINEYKPAIVHFSGHGSDESEIVFQDSDGNAKTVSKDAIIQTIMASSEGIRLVFFNTCYSQTQAESVVKHVEAAIGMKTSIGDEAARIFSSQFYSSIGFGFSIQKAFDQAKARLMMENIPEEDTPELFIHNGLNAYELVIVKPPTL